MCRLALWLAVIGSAGDALMRSAALMILISVAIGIAIAVLSPWWRVRSTKPALLESFDADH